jgi:hypothetical protein
MGCRRKATGLTLANFLRMCQVGGWVHGGQMHALKMKKLLQLDHITVVAQHK